MTIILEKGQKINLIKKESKLNKVMIGLGWDVKVEKKGFFKTFFGGGDNIDCDASVILLKNGKLDNTSDVIYYGNLKHFSNSVRHTGDNLTGDGDGDDEQIIVDLKNIPNKYDKIIIVANIYNAISKNQHFGMIENAFIRIVNLETNKEICKFNLSDNYIGMTAMIFGEIYRKGEEWEFSAIGEGTKDADLSSLIKKYK